MSPEYLPCLFRLRSTDHYVIWYSDDQDGLVRENGQVVVFPSPQSSKPMPFDVAWTSSWPKSPRTTGT